MSITVLGPTDTPVSFAERKPHFQLVGNTPDETTLGVAIFTETSGHMPRIATLYSKTNTIGGNVKPDDGDPVGEGIHAYVADGVDLDHCVVTQRSYVEDPTPAAGAIGGRSTWFTSTVAGALTPRFGLNNKGTVFITDDEKPTSSDVDMGLVIDQKTEDGKILALKSTGDVTHGMTTRAETSTYGFAGKNYVGEGGVMFIGLTEGAEGFQVGSMATNDDTSKTTTARGGVHINAQKKTGTSSGAISNDANLAIFRNYTSVVVGVKGDGKIFWPNTSTTYKGVLYPGTDDKLYFEDSGGNVKEIAFV